MSHSASSPPDSISCGTVSVVPTPNVTSQTLYDLTRAEAADLLDGAASYRIEQLWRGLYDDAVDVAEITTLSKELRRSLTDQAPAALTEIVKSQSDDGETIKWLWRLPDGEAIETVLMHYDDRSTVCVSSQAGCAMACGFCATGQGGFQRHLSVGEIVEQVVRAKRAASPRRLSNVVFMGMGEPLANIEATLAAAQRIHRDLGLSARHITVSTVGLVPGIRRLTEAQLPVSLAVSLHASTDELRDELVPINKRYPLPMLIDACIEYRETTRRRVSFEWAMISNVNDSDEQADELARWCAKARAHVNLIPLNPTPGYPTVGSSPERVLAFRDRLRNHGVNATVRKNRGTDIDAACGQLKAASSDVATDLTSTAVLPPTRRS